MKICLDFQLARSWTLGGKFNSNSKNMSVKFKPLADRVLIEPVPAEQKTASGIIIPDTAKEKPLKGTVIAVGPGKKDEPLSVKKGDSVLYGQYSGTEIKIDGKNFLIMKESDIYGVFNKK
jgi:chaperonin GroES